MTRPLTTRISTLERIKRVDSLANAICAECGCPVGMKPGSIGRFTVSFEDDPDDIPEFCPGCGRHQVYKLEFDRPGDDEHPTPIK